MIDIIVIGDEWPGGISDGLTLLCPYCDQVPSWDYHVTDECWAAVVPKDGKHLGVVCLPCLDKLAVRRGIDISTSITQLQFTGIGKTVVFMPTQAYKWSREIVSELAAAKMRGNDG